MLLLLLLLLLLLFVDHSVPVTPLDNSLIPLREDGEEERGREADEIEEEEEDEDDDEDISDQSLVEEAMSLAHELGMRCGQAAREYHQDPGNLLEVSN